MANIIFWGKGIKYNKLISKWSFIFILTKLNFVPIQIKQIRFKNDSIEMEKPTQISTEALLHIGIEPFQVSRDHEDKTKAANSSEIRYAQESVIKYFFDNHDNRPEVFSLFN